MYKAIIISGLVLLYSALLFLPNLPFVQYYYSQSKIISNNQNLSQTESDVLVGDICFLQALINRTQQTKEATNENKLPEPNNSGSLVYLIVDVVKLNTSINSNSITYLNDNELLTCRYLQIPSPPPKVII